MPVSLPLVPHFVKTYPLIPPLRFAYKSLLAEIEFVVNAAFCFVCNLCIFISIHEGRRDDVIDVPDVHPFNLQERNMHIIIFEML